MWSRMWGNLFLKRSSESTMLLPQNLLSNSSNLANLISIYRQFVCRQNDEVSNNLLPTKIHLSGTKQRPPIWKILDPPLFADKMMRCRTICCRPKSKWNKIQADFTSGSFGPQFEKMKIQLSSHVYSPWP